MLIIIISHNHKKQIYFYKDSVQPYTNINCGAFTTNRNSQTKLENYLANKKGKLTNDKHCIFILNLKLSRTAVTTE